MLPWINTSCQDLIDSDCALMQLGKQICLLMRSIKSSDIYHEYILIDKLIEFSHSGVSRD